MQPWYRREFRLPWDANATIWFLIWLSGLSIGLIWPAAYGVGWPEWLEKYDTLVAASLAIIGFGTRMFIGVRQEKAGAPHGDA